MRKLAAAFLLVFFLTNAGATKLDSTIADQCPADYEPVISMPAPNDTYSNPAGVGFYEHNLCVRGITEAEISNSGCTKSTGFYIYDNSSDSHFSTNSVYNLHVCTAEMKTQVRNSCLSNQTALMSVSGTTNAHVAWPGFYSQDVCGFYANPENVSISLEFNLTSSDQVLVDDSQVGEQEIRIAEFPYIVSEGNNRIAGIVSSDLIRVERTLDTENTLLMEKEAEEASFIVPFTKGDHETVEDHQERILSNRFLEQVSPSFSFFIPENPVIKVALDPGITIKSNLSIGTGTHTIAIRKTSDNTVKIVRR